MNFVEWLKENKEKLTLGLTVLLVAGLVFQAPLLVEPPQELERAQFVSRQTAEGLDVGQAQRADDRFRNPEQPKPRPIDEKAMRRRFYTDDDRYERARSSIFSRSKEELTGLPPLALLFPSFPELPDFDLPAGPMPDVRFAQGYVPRDKRPVVLTRPDETDFRE
jgi:hypothetical protein